MQTQESLHSSSIGTTLPCAHAPAYAPAPARYFSAASSRVCSATPSPMVCRSRRDSRHSPLCQCCRATLQGRECKEEGLHADMGEFLLDCLLVGGLLCTLCLVVTPVLGLAYRLHTFLWRQPSPPPPPRPRGIRALSGFWPARATHCPGATRVPSWSRCVLRDSTSCCWHHLQHGRHRDPDGVGELGHVRA